MPTQNQENATITSNGLYTHLAGYRIRSLQNHQVATALRGLDTHQWADRNTGAVFFARETAQRWYAVALRSRDLDGAISSVTNVLKTDGAVATVLQEDDLSEMKVHHDSSSDGLLSWQAESPGELTEFRIHSDVSTTLCTESDTGSLEAAMSFLISVTEADLEGVSTKAAEQASKSSDEGVDLYHLRKMLLVRLRNMIRAAIEMDGGLISHFVEGPVTNPKRAAIRQMMMWVTFFVDGKVGKLSRLEPQMWCID